MASPLYVEPADLDPQQRFALEGISNDDNICIVTGCAGCGKSALALLRLTSLCAETTSAHPAFVTVARALTDNIFNELRAPVQRYVNQFKVSNPCQHPVINTFSSAFTEFVGSIHTFPPHIDRQTTHLMLDEYQDLRKSSLEEIHNLIKNCKQVCFFGDYEQQIFMGGAHEKDPISVEYIEMYYKKKGRQVLTYELDFNYRVSQNVARLIDSIRHTFTNNSSEGDLTDKCQRENGEKPYLLHFDTIKDMLETVRQVSHNRQNINDSYRAALFTGTNQACSELAKMSLSNTRSLSFSTVHKSKGCQFDDVFIYLNDILDNIKDEDQRFKILHVAMTRPEKGLFLMYTGNRPEIFDQIPEDLYLESLSNDSTSQSIHGEANKNSNNNDYNLPF